MRDSHSVITQATEGIVKKLADRREISVARMYEQLSETQCVYPKAKLLIRDIGSISKERARLIKADLDALFREILDDDAAEEIDIAELHRESSEAVHAVLSHQAKEIQKKEIREMVAVGEKALEVLEKPKVREVYDDSIRLHYGHKN